MEKCVNLHDEKVERLKGFIVNVKVKITHMKKSVLLFVAMASAFIGLSSVSVVGNDNVSAPDINNVNQTKSYVITPTGVGPVQLEADIAKLPKSSEGIYDSYRIVADEGMPYVVFTYKDVDVMRAETFGVVDANGNEANVITTVKILKDSPVRYFIQGKLYKVGDNVKELIDGRVIKKAEGPFCYYEYKGVTIFTGTESDESKQTYAVTCFMVSVGADFWESWF